MKNVIKSAKWLNLVDGCLDFCENIAFNLHNEASQFKEYSYTSSVVIGNIPSIYIKTQSQKQVEHIALDEERVLLIGPKGTGKSKCLVPI